MHRLLMIAATLAAGAPAAAQSPYPHRSSAEEFSCRPTGLPQFSGQMPTADVARQMLTVSGSKKLRWVAHGQQADGGTRSDRVTVQLDAQGRIDSARCG